MPETTELPSTRQTRRAWHEQVLRDNSPRWEDMTKAERSLFIEESIEAGHRRQYEGALKLCRRTGPDWDDLTEEQRTRIRDTNREHADAMHKFGETLRQQPDDA